AGGEQAPAVEISRAASAAIVGRARRTRLENVEVVTANAFDFLRDAVDEGRRFDTIVLDPPSFAKNKAAVEAALRGYKEINLRSLQLLAPGGVLMSASCTYHVDEEAFEAMLAAAAADARPRGPVVERRRGGRGRRGSVGWWTQWAKPDTSSCTCSGRWTDAGRGGRMRRDRLGPAGGHEPERLDHGHALAGSADFGLRERLPDPGAPLLLRGRVLRDRPHPR